MRRLIGLFLASTLAPLALAQTKVDLSSQVKGQLPTANATAVIAAATTAATAAAIGPATTAAVSQAVPQAAALAALHGTTNGGEAGLSADGSVGGDNSYTESFYSDFTCPIASGSTSAVPSGWDVAVNHNCYSGFVVPTASGTPMTLVRNLPYAGFIGLSQATQYGLQFRAYYTGTANAVAVGLSAAVNKAVNTTPALSYDAVITASGFGVADKSGTPTIYWPLTTTPVAGSTDSGFGTIGWGAPPIGNLYDVSLFVPNDGTAILSVMRKGTVNNSASFRLPHVTLPVCVSPCGSVGTAAGPQNLEVNGLTGNDRIMDVALSIASGDTSTSVGYPIPHRSGYYGGPAMLRFYVSATGLSCTTGGVIGACSDGTTCGTTVRCQTVYAWVPPLYDRRGPSKWALFAHGYGEDAQIVQLQYNSGAPANVSDTLFRKGYVLVSAENTVANCYGSPQCVVDLKNAVAVVKSALALAGQPYVIADSMGAEQVLSAIAQGVITPKAFYGVCINASLAWQNSSLSFPNGGNQAANIEAAYSFTNPSLYSTATAGYDPLLAAQTAGIAQQRLASVPTLLYATPTDTAVAESYNTDAYAAAINAVSPGEVTVVACSGNHQDPSCFNGAAVASFFAQF